MNVLKAIFWLSAAVVAYTYAGYALVISALAVRWPRPHLQTPIQSKVTLIIAAYNEAVAIREKILNSLNQTYPRDLLEIIVVSDGSTDGTTAIVEAFNEQGVVSMYHPTRLGKAAAMSRAASVAQGEILVFSDANCMYSLDSIEKLVRNFADGSVGAVAGEKRILNHGEGLSGEAGLYWRYESFLKRMDSRVNSVVGAAGEVFAVRRSLFRPAEPDSIIEDFVISMRIAASGYRVVYEPEAIAIEEPPASAADEFERRSRISAGGFQSIVRLRGLLRSPSHLLVFQYVSHRVLRWAVVPFLLPLMLMTNCALAPQPLYRRLLALQIGSLFLAGVGWAMESSSHQSPKIVRVAFYFYMLNIAALGGFWRYITRRQAVTWARTNRLTVERDMA